MEVASSLDMNVIPTLVATAVISAALSAWLAYAKGWDGKLWGIIGLLLGPLGLIASAGLPDQKLHQKLRYLEKYGKEDINDQIHSSTTPRQLFKTRKTNSNPETFNVRITASYEEIWNEACRTASADEADYEKSYLGSELIELKDANGELIARFEGEPSGKRRVFKRL